MEEVPGVWSRRIIEVAEVRMEEDERLEQHSEQVQQEQQGGVN